jgi:type IV secretory pathway VirJ component
MKVLPLVACVLLQPAAQSADRTLADLPLMEQPLRAGCAAPTGAMVLMLSGDGGWASIDRRLAAAFLQRGIPVVGLDSLRYFWHERSPEETARDVAAVITHYLAAWHCRQVEVVGYSFGADVLPFVVNRLPREVAARIASLTLLEPSSSATFEIHVSNWLPGVVTPGLPLAPELAKLRPPPLCVHGDEEPSVCRDVPRATVAQIGRGHHLGGDGDAIVERILSQAVATGN